MKTVESKIIFSATDHLSGTLKRMSDNLAPFAKRMQAVGQRMQEVGEKLSLQVSLPIIAAGYGLIKPAMEFEKVMADLNKTLAQAGEQFEDTKKRALDMSDDLGTNFIDIGSVMSSGSGTGIKAAKDLDVFTRHTVKMAVAFDMAQEKAGEIFNTIYTASEKSLPKAIALTDTVNLLANNINASGEKISEFLTRSLGLGNFYGLTDKQTAAIGATFISLGAEADVAATSFQNLFKGLLAGPSATKAQKKAFKELGTSAEEMQKKMAINPLEALEFFFNRLDKIPAVKQFTTLANTIGLEGVKVTASAIKNVKSLKENLALAADETKSLNSINIEYSQITKTADNRTKALNVKFQNLRATLGNVLLPTYIEMVEKLEKVTQSTRKWAEANPELTNKIVKNTAVIAGMAVVTGPLLWIGGKLIAVFTKLGHTLKKLFDGFKWVSGGILKFASMMGGNLLGALRSVKLGILSKISAFKIMNATLTTSSGVIGGFGRAMSLASFAVRGIGIALASTPIGAIITAGLIVGGILVVKYWEQIKTLFTSFASTVSDKLGPTLKRLSETFGRIFEKISPITKVFGIIYDKIVALFAPVDATKESLDAWKNAGELLGKAFSFSVEVIIGIVEGFLWVLEQIIDAITAIANGEFGKWVNGMVDKFVNLTSEIGKFLAQLTGFEMPDWMSSLFSGNPVAFTHKFGGETPKISMPNIPDIEAITNNPNSTVSRLKKISANQNYIPNSVGTDAKFTANVKITDERVTVVQNTVMNGKTTKQEVKSLNTGKNSPLKAIQ